MGNPDKPFCLTGLSAAQVQQKKESGKQNLPPEKSTKSTSQILKDNICTLFNLFNVLIAIALALVGAWSNMMFICIIAVNTLIGIVQELHAKKLVEVVDKIPMEKILIETDSPYLAPNPNRGKRNDSRNLQFVVEKIAEIKKLSPEDVAKITFDNAKSLFF